MKKRTIVVSILLIVLFQYAGAQEVKNDYDLKMVPIAMGAVKVMFPLYSKWHLSGQVDVQYSMQDNYNNKNPFEYSKNFDRRAWLVYKGIHNAKLALGFSNKDKYYIPGINTMQSEEQRIIAYATFTQPSKDNSVNTFEQLRTEVRFFDDSKDIRRIIPRICGRFGTTYFLHQHAAHPLLIKPSLSWYTDLTLRFPPANYASSHFELLKVLAYYSAEVNGHLSFDAMCATQLQLKPNGKQFVLSYGPQIIARYNL